MERDPSAGAMMLDAAVGLVFAIHCAASATSATASPIWCAVPSLAAAVLQDLPESSVGDSGCTSQGRVVGTEDTPPGGVPGWWLGSALPHHHAPPSPRLSNLEQIAADLREAAPEPSDRRWHIDLALRVSDAEMASTAKILDRRLKLPLRADIFGVFDRPRTPLDRKTDLAVNTPLLGLGRQETDWLVWTFHIGAGVASDDTHQRFLNANLKVRFRYATYCAGLTTELYPWGVPRYASDLDWTQRLKRSRPFALAGLEVGYVNAEGAGYYALAPIKLYRDEEKVRDWTASCRLGLGWAIPLNDCWSVNLAGDRSFHFYKPQEYDSWNVTLGLRYRF